jgi:hypothetical protein
MEKHQYKGKKYVASVELKEILHSKEKNGKK